MLSMELPRSLWPAVRRIAAGRGWPPCGAEETRAFFEEAKLQFLLPLLFAERDLPPLISEALPRYRAIERLSSARSEILEHDLQRLVARLDDEDIVLLKGSDYGHRIYDKPAHRPMADIDILVPSGRIAAVAARLEADGFRRRFHGGAAWHLQTPHTYVLTT